jgi:hypothetical protein
MISEAGADPGECGGGGRTLSENVLQESSVLMVNFSIYPSGSLFVDSDAVDETFSEGFY